MSALSMVMTNVEYPIVFYSYYNKLGSPGAISGRLQSTPEKVKLWNATRPIPSAGGRCRPWKHIAINNLTATGTTGYSTILEGLPLAGYYWEDVKLNNVFISGGPGLEIYDATNVQFAGDTQVGPLTCNSWPSRASAEPDHRHRHERDLRGGRRRYSSSGVKASAPGSNGASMAPPWLTARGRMGRWCRIAARGHPQGG